MNDAHPLKSGMEALNFIKQPAQKGDLAQVLEREQAGAQPVVQVMCIIGYVVGQGRALRLRAGVKFQIKWKYLCRTR